MERGISILPVSFFHRFTNFFPQISLICENKKFRQKARANASVIFKTPKKTIRNNAVILSAASNIL